MRRATHFGFLWSSRLRNFYPRSPCGERPPSHSSCSRNRKFLSTLSLRRATTVNFHAKARKSHFYPRSPCGERPAPPSPPTTRVLFLSTLSLRRATARRALGFVDPDISIHALLAESDLVRLTPKSTTGHFYPRSPCGERPGLGVGLYLVTEISIHALLAESDETVFKRLFG